MQSTYEWIPDDLSELSLEDFIDVPTTKERFEAIDKRLDGIDGRLVRIDEAVGLKVPEAKKGFLRQKYEWAINHKGTALILAVILCLVGIFGKYWIDHKQEWWNDRVDGRVQAVLTAKGGIQDTLGEVRQTTTRIEATLNTLQPFIHDVITRQFENAAKLPASLLRERLPAIKDLLAAAKDQKVKIDPKTVSNLSKNLIATESNSPGFWPAAAELISYRSFNTADRTFPDNLPNCTDHKPTPPRVKSIQDEHHMILENSVYENCHVALDSPLDDQRINNLLMNETVGITFKNCVITYQGGEINLIVAFHDRMVEMSPLPDRSIEPTIARIDNPATISFDNCLFAFRFNNTPPLQGQQLTQTLLNTTAPTINFGVQKPSTHS